MSQKIHTIFNPVHTMMEPKNKQIAVMRRRHPHQQKRNSNSTSIGDGCRRSHFASVWTVPKFLRMAISFVAVALWVTNQDFSQLQIIVAEGFPQQSISIPCILPVLPASRMLRDTTTGVRLLSGDRRKKPTPQSARRIPGFGPPVSLWQGPRFSVKGGDGGVDKGFNLLELASSRLGFLPPLQPALVSTAKASWKALWMRLMTELAPQNPVDGSYQRPSYMTALSSGGQRALPRLESPLSRYQVFVGNPCPWCHRVVLTAAILGLCDSSFTSKPNLLRITKLIDDPTRASRGGWILPAKAARDDAVFGSCKDLRQVYDACQPGYTGRCTAPLLVDIQTMSIISNESSDIVRMLNEFNQRVSPTSSSNINLYPAEFAQAIDDANGWIYEYLNNGVYRCGFCTKQQSYDAAVRDVQTGLQKCEQILSTQRYIVSNDQLTESDVRLLPTLLRFDGVYGPLFRAGGGVERLKSDYPCIHDYVRRLWNEYPEVRGSIDLADACQSYYKQLFPLNPSGILPPSVTPEVLGLQ
jgi:glutathionyl-hydroquinone reductase